ncbi:VOC family protein [Mesobacillus subterraneus]|jgi:glyoxylase I family protein|uniref:SMU1112c/YaeR family gloxylase I-like metalloprotein n=1 Tax=Mesobacillus subterraneus TaxID=285983 RepID=UPI00203F03C5|nr:VOC family protein [Mesobacillus subterraneus]MCM3664826.1 VOC family protein [Mesobacillus subterraneus]MCM3681915.1 VOC family protein [Mesobacillus subterraneus]
MELKKIHHVAIICSDYEKSKDFYINVLGLKMISEVFRENRNSFKLDLAVGNHCQIELFSFPESPERPSYPEAAGLRHIAFSVEELAAAVDDLLSKGVEVEPIRVDTITQKKYTFFADPDGLPIELYEV